MHRAVSRYRFAPATPPEEVEAALLLALLAAESLHGEAQVRLDAGHLLDPSARVLVIAADTPVGRDVNRLFVNFARREFGEESFRVERVVDAPDHEHQQTHA